MSLNYDEYIHCKTIAKHSIGDSVKTESGSHVISRVIFLRTGQRHDDFRVEYLSKSGVKFKEGDIL